MKKHTLYKSVLLATAALGSGFALPVVAQQGKGVQLEEVIVTARRREERLQEVPISMTVFTQAQLDNNNITNAGDIATYTPSLTVNSRFGNDLTSFAIRGFVQELRTTSSVGVYFADVVAPRGSNSQVSGDGAGPGMFFDLANVQVLKGPQGTLFGRNTTGGAVLLVPNKPTEEFDGYIEGSAGNYSMQREQAVINIPATDSIRMRFGVDRKKQDGYLNNVGGIGPDDFGDVDYLAGRASLVIDITENLENYFIYTYSHSKNNGSFTTVTDCNTTALGGGAFGGFLGDLCQEQLDRQAAAGDTDFWDTAQGLPHPRSKINEERYINTTTWEITDDLIVKNILAYARLKTTNNSPIWGTNYQFQPYAAPPGATIPFRFAASGARGDGVDITNSSTLVEELQFQGELFDDKLTWQAGVYYERTKPEGDVGQSSPSNLSCDFGSIESGDPADWRCNDVFAGAAILGLIQRGVLPPQAYGNEAAYLGAPLRVGSISGSLDSLKYTNKAAYVQTTYNFTDQWGLTLGLRYTDDETRGKQTRRVYRFPYDPLFGTFAPYESAVDSTPKDENNDTHDPTWLVGVDYKPTVDSLYYAKYARGYRQGSINVSSQPGLLTSDPEKVDTYELGTKLSFNGAIPGIFNAAIFYNDFRDQQIQNGLLLSQEYGGVGSTAIVNAGKSRIWGVELDTTWELLDGFTVSAAYTYLNTKVKSLEDFTDIIAATGARPSTLTAVEGDDLPYTPENSVVVNANYRLPVSEQIGTIIAGATYVYTDNMRASASTPYSPLSVLPSYHIVNLNLTWNSIAGGPLDASFFVTNVLNEEYYTYATGAFSTLESESALPGQPRMLGARLRYNFNFGDSSLF